MGVSVSILTNMYTNRLNAAFSSAVSWISMVRNSTRQPIVSSSGILNLTEFQFVELIISNSVGSSSFMFINFSCITRKSRLLRIPMWFSMRSSIVIDRFVAYSFRKLTTSVFMHTLSSLYSSRFFGEFQM